MAVRHVKVGGTKAAGNSTADDWTLANCYPTIATAMAGSTAGAGDELILEDETHTVASMIAESFGFAGAFTIRGRTARADNSTAPAAIISGSSASGALFIFNDTVNRADIEFRDVGFTKSVTHTDSARPLAFHVTQKTGNVTLTRVWFHDVDVSFSGSTSWRLGMFSCQQAPTAAATVRMNGVRFDNISGSFGTGFCSLLYETAVNGWPAGSEIIKDDVVIRNISASIGGQFRFSSTNGKTTIRGYDAEGVTLTSTDTTNGVGTLYYKDSVGKLFARDIKMKNIAATSGYVDAEIQVWSDYDVANVLGINVQHDSTNHDDTSGIGCLIAFFNGKLGTIRKVRAYRCKSKFGTAVYISNGAYGTVDTAWAEECECGNGLYYKGGNGDVSWSNLVAVNNTQIDVVASSSAALVFYGHNGGSTGPAATCTMGVRNLIAKGNYHPQSATPISFSQPTDDAAVFNVVARDITCRDESDTGYSIRVGIKEVNLDIAGCNLAGTIENAGTGTVTESGTTDSDVVIIGGLSMDTELDDRWPVAYRVST